MYLAEVVRVRVARRAEGADGRHLVGVVVGERGNRLAGTPHLGTQPGLHNSPTLANAGRSLR